MNDLFLTDYCDRRPITVALSKDFEIVSLQEVNPDTGRSNYTRLTYSADGTMNMHSICVAESPRVIQAQINTIRMMLEPSK
jgi:hypothetical protein